MIQNLILLKYIKSFLSLKYLFKIMNTFFFLNCFSKLTLRSYQIWRCEQTFLCFEMNKSFFKYSNHFKNKKEYDTCLFHISGVIKSLSKWNIHNFQVSYWVLTPSFNGRSMCILLNAGWDASVNLYSNDW